ncbi:hypothetical protein KY366_04885 [Candidatus Woesearchaeota archaeon]|nr:hypothetical protein [Candidatus Woesearchaeota archaeon]
MGLFRKKKAPSTELIQLHSLLDNSFRNVQKDTAYILQWLNYFYHKNLHQEQQIKQLREELDYMPKSREDIRKIVDEFYSYEPILNRIKELNQHVDELRASNLDLHNKHNEIFPKMESLKAELKSELTSKSPQFQPQIPPSEVDQLARRLEKLESKKATIKEKIIKRITKNSKDYVKSIVFSYIKKYGKVTALQLKEMVVEEQGLCSKSSFYRILEELEEEPEIGVIKKGKEKHYIQKNIAYKKTG